MTARLHCGIRLVVLTVLVAWHGTGRSAQAQGPLRIECSHAGIRCFEDLWGAWCEQTGAVGTVHGRSNAVLVSNWTEGRCQAIVHSGPLESYEWDSLNAIGPRQDFVEWEIGRFSVAVVVHPTNPVKSLTMAELSGILQGKINNWSKVRGGRGQEIVVVGQSERTNAYYIVQQHCCRAAFVRGDLTVRDESREVLSEVRTHPGALGFYLYDGAAPDGVKLLELSPQTSPEDRADPVPLTAQSVQSGKYPLYDSLRLVAHRKAAWAQPFYRFVTSPAGGKIVSNWKMAPESDRLALLSAERMELVKAGKGQPLIAGGERAGAALLEALALEYARSTTAIQLRYAPGLQTAAVGRFVEHPEQELLLLDSDLSAETLARHGGKWVAQRPGRLRLGSDAVALVIHPANKLGSLTREQIAAIFAAKLRDWWNLPQASKTEIHRYGLPAAHPLSKRFDRVVMGELKPTAMTRKESSAEVLSAVALDPQAIGFVSLADIPQGEKSIKILAIGPEGTPAVHSARDLLTKDYLLAEPWTLYVSPRAGAVARDFAEFIASSAGAEFLARHGIVPLAKLPQGN